MKFPACCEGKSNRAPQIEVSRRTHERGRVLLCTLEHKLIGIFQPDLYALHWLIVLNNFDVLIRVDQPLLVGLGNEFLNGTVQVEACFDEADSRMRHDLAPRLFKLCFPPRIAPAP